MGKIHKHTGLSSNNSNGENSIEIGLANLRLGMTKQKTSIHGILA